MEYSYNTDNIETKGFISKKDILNYVTEEEIFQLVFDFKPIEYEYITSPFRKDSTPGCWFERDVSTNKLRFVDFGDPRIIKGIKMANIDCFDAVMLHYKLSNFYKSLEFVYNSLIKGKKTIVRPPQIRIVKPKKNVKILFESRNFLPKDGKFWSRYEISKNNLIEDKVFPVKKFTLLNTKNGDITNRVYESCYSYTEFGEGRKKLYFPYRKGNKRFITNCKKNDIGGKAPLLGRQIVITKSYKDYRVLKNQGLNCIWNQNEGMIPDADILIPKIKGYNDIVIWYDNDESGIKAANKIREFITGHINKSRVIYLPEELNNIGISDPSDLIYKKSKHELIKFIKEKL